jgi:hypothetical protein
MAPTASFVLSLDVSKIIGTHAIQASSKFFTRQAPRGSIASCGSASNILTTGMSEEDLKQRLAYFQQRLEEAKRRHSAKEPHPRTFDAGYTTETFKTWAESIAVINERLATINDQLKAQKSNLAQKDL